MKKLLALMSFVVLSAMLSFAGTITYYNRTSETVRFLRDSNPVGPGDVMPGGFTQENVGYGSYLLSATDGRQYAPGYTCTIDASDDGCEYTVFSGSAFIGNNNPNLRTVSLRTVSDTQTVPYSASQFSATFNNGVAVSTYSTNTATNTEYFSTDSRGVTQDIVVRFVDHDIPVDYSSSDYYLNHDTFGGALSNVARGTYQGRVFTYGFFDKAPDGNGGLRSERIRFIIVNSREVIMIAQIAPEAVDDQQEWFAFEDSLNIR